MKVCIIGVGNIGMRYVQGITKTFPAAELSLVDCDERLKELEALKLDNVELFPSLDDIDHPVDLFVVSTSCAPRLALYKQCLVRKPRYVILEKYLFQGRREFEECLSLDRVPTFVNQWLYGSKAFDCLFENEVRSVEISGDGWGLACNAVHWMDMLQRQMGISRLGLGSGTRISEVFASKRAGYEEMRGELVFVDENSEKRFKLVDLPDDALTGQMKINIDGRDYSFDYTEIKDNEKVLSRFPYFSELIGGIVGELLATGNCHLPSLEASITQHLLIEDVLETLDQRPKIT